AGPVEVSEAPSMNRNMELKARCADLEAARRKAQVAGAEPRGLLLQTDTYFRCTAGRLKLREIEGEGAELIGYHRTDEACRRLCPYARVPISDPAAMKQLLVDSLGLRGVLKKRRELWMWRHVRIHLDDVHGLGTFLELEAVLPAEATIEDGERVLAELTEKL